MADEPHDLMLAMLRRLNDRLDVLQGDITDIKTRMTSIEAGQAPIRQEMAQQSVQIAGLNGRMHRFDERLRRVERKLATQAERRLDPACA